MSFFPMFIELENQCCVIVGGGAVALRKAKSLLSCGAVVSVIAPHMDPEFMQYPVQRFEREFQEKDLEHAHLVIAATNDLELNERIVTLCNERRIYVNSATRTNGNTFLFPGMVKQGDITIGVSTAGKSPILTKQICNDIVQHLPKTYETGLELLSEIRRVVTSRIVAPSDRRTAIETLTTLVLNGEDVTKEMIEEVIKQYES